MPHLRIPALLATLATVAVLIACGGDDAAEPSPNAPGSPTSSPTATAEPVPDSVLLEELEQVVFDTVPEDARGEPSDFEGISGVAAFRMPGPGDIFATVTVGRPNFNPFFPHFVAAYAYEGPGTWTELSRVDLASIEFIDYESLDIVEIEPSADWLLVRGSVGVHGTGLMLVRFDGEELSVEVEHIADAQLAGQVAGDLTGDGTQEVVLDTSNYYVFCYACGVVHWDATVLRWDGNTMAPLELEELPASAGPAAAPNNELVALAQAGRLVEAAAIIDTNSALRDENDTFNRNAIVVEQTLLLFENNASNPAYPLLHDVFSGDWENAVARMEEHPPEDVFAEPSVLIAGTVAEGNEPQLSAAIVGAADAALTVDPALAELHLLRAWGLWLADPSDPAVAEELALASELAPDDAFIEGALGIVGG